MTTPDKEREDLLARLDASALGDAFTYPCVDCRDAAALIRTQAAELERLRAELEQEHAAREGAWILVAKADERAAQAKRLYELALTNEERWMRLHEAAERSLAAANAELEQYKAKALGRSCLTPDSQGGYYCIEARTAKEAHAREIAAVAHGVIERCAKVCEDMEIEFSDARRDPHRITVAIRALAQPAQGAAEQCRGDAKSIRPTSGAPNADSGSHPPAQAGEGEQK